jgi:DNA-binding transcriptional ArsR family regulator
VVNNNLDRAFLAYSHPVRRTILERLAERDLTVREATRGCPVSKPAISRHLKVLERAGAIVRVVEGRNHRLALRERPFADARDWIERQQRLWERKFDVVEDYLREQRDHPRSTEERR